MIELQELTKRYGGRRVVDGLTFCAPPGAVTGLVGPNGAGKSTALRMLLGLCRPDAGRATIAGLSYRALQRPMHRVGALIDGAGPHRSMTAVAYLRWLAAAAGIERRRVADVIDLVGLSDATTRRVGGYSLGMSRRLGLAAALIGDPEVLVLDEPVNGLDPQGIRWLRGLLRSHATDGGTVLLSSHLIAELALIADRLVVIDRGHLLADDTIAALLAAHAATAATARPAATEAGVRLEDAVLALIDGNRR